MALRWLEDGSGGSPPLLFFSCRICFLDLVFDASCSGVAVALKSRAWDGGVWAVVEARRMSSLSRRSAWGRWIWYSEKFFRRSLFLRWSSVP